MIVNRPLILGIDPGLSGALALYNYPGNRIEEVIDMPVLEGGKKRKIDIQNLATWIEINSEDIRLAVIEEVGVMTGKEGRVSMFNFGEGVGILKGILAANYIPVYFVKPAVWKSLCNLNYEKNRSIEKVKELFPESKHHFTLKKHDGRAEASLLAHFGTRFIK